MIASRGSILCLAIAGVAPACSPSDVIPDAGFTDCSTDLAATITIHTPADPPMELRIESCRRDVDACLDLCTLALTREHIQAFQPTCTVTFDASTVTAQVAYLPIQCMPVQAPDQAGF